MAGDPLPFDDQVKSWAYWIAGRDRRRAVPPLPPDDDPTRSLKDTTHISVIDKDGNIFDWTPSGGWITGGGDRRNDRRRHERRGVSSSGSTRIVRRRSGRAPGRATR